MVTFMRSLKFFPLFLFLALVLTPFSGALRAATLSVTMSNPTCVQAAADSGNCYIVIRSINAVASDQSFTNLDISIDGKVRARLQPFFETTFNLTNRMFGPGLMVPCRRSNNGGDPAYGHLYQVSYKGYLAGSTGLAAFGTASVYCPYYQESIYLPIVER